MSVSTLSTKNRVSLPEAIVEAARLRVNDEIAWTVDAAGRIMGQKVGPVSTGGGKLAKDAKTGLLYWRGGLSAAEIEDAALNSNPIRE